MNEISQTSLGAAMIRALEQYLSLPLYEDKLSEKLLPFKYKLMLATMKVPFIRNVLLKMREKQFPGFLGGLVCRTRYFDDVLVSALGDQFKSIVITGAGLDTRAYRIPGIEKARIYEVDQPEVLEYKKEKLEKVLGKIPGHVTFVPVDLSRQTLEEGLKSKGFDMSDKSLFMFEGVLQYLPQKSVETAFEFIGKSCEGSRLVFTYIVKDFFEGKDLMGIPARAARIFLNKKDFWQSSFNPEDLESYFLSLGLFISEHVGTVDYQERYLIPLNRKISVFKIERAVAAEVQKSSHK